MAASIIEVTDEHLVSLAHLWKPYREELLEKYRHVQTKPPESVQWDWLVKKDIERPARTVVLAIVTHEAHAAESAVQGLVMLTRDPVPSRYRLGASAIYVNFLEAAPWNQKMYVEPAEPRYTLVGNALIAAAARFSQHSGCAGALALHSVKEKHTLDFYARLHFHDLGFDSEVNYQYLEMDPTPSEGQPPEVQR